MPFVLLFVHALPKLIAHSFARSYLLGLAFQSALDGPPEVRRKSSDAVRSMPTLVVWHLVVGIPIILQGLVLLGTWIIWRHQVDRVQSWLQAFAGGWVLFGLPAVLLAVLFFWVPFAAVRNRGTVWQAFKGGFRGLAFGASERAVAHSDMRGVHARG